MNEEMDVVTIVKLTGLYCDEPSCKHAKECLHSVHAAKEQVPTEGFKRIDAEACMADGKYAKYFPFPNKKG